MEKEPKQLKLLNNEGEIREKKEKGQKGNKWVVFFILLLTVAATLLFYFSGGGKLEMEGPNLGAPKVYQF